MTRIQIKMAVGATDDTLAAETDSPARVSHFLEKSMKTILSVALILAFCGLTRAADDKTNPIGTWKCEYSIGDQQRTATLTITKEADKLAGTMTWPNQKETKVTNLKQKDAQLTFAAVREIGDNKYPVEYKLTIEGDTLKGKGTVEFNGQKNDFDIEGKREKKEK